MKPGMKSTEFWMTLGAIGVSVLTAFGIIGPDQADAMTANLSKIVGSVVAVIASMNYTNSRGKIKSNEQRATVQTPPPPQPAVPKLTEVELLQKELSLMKKELELSKKS